MAAPPVFNLWARRSERDRKDGRDQREGRLGRGVLILWVVFGMVPLGWAADEATTRIVSLVPNVTEILFSIGAGGQLVGDSDFCKYPDAAKGKPKVGGFLNPNLEKIIALRPTAVVVLNSQGELAGKLEGLGIHPVIVQSDSIADVYESLERVGLLTGQTTEAAKLERDIRDKLGALRKVSEKRSRVRTLIVVGRQPAALQDIYAAGPHTYLGEILEAAGGENVLEAGARPYAAVTKEQIVQSNPDVIIDTSLGEAGSNATVVEAHKKVWSDLPMVGAVKSGRVYYLSDPYLTIPGVNIPATAEKLAELLNPTAAR